MFDFQFIPLQKPVAGNLMPVHILFHSQDASVALVKVRTFKPIFDNRGPDETYIASDYLEDCVLLKYIDKNVVVQKPLFYNTRLYYKEDPSLLKWLQQLKLTLSSKEG